MSTCKASFFYKNSSTFVLTNLTIKCSYKLENDIFKKLISIPAHEALFRSTCFGTWLGVWEPTCSYCPELWDMFGSTITQPSNFLLGRGYNLCFGELFLTIGFRFDHWHIFQEEGIPHDQCASSCKRFRFNHFWSPHLNFARLSHNNVLHVCPFLYIIGWDLSKR